MHIVVINGSPKGEYSITLQTVRYLERRFPADTFEVLHAGQRIRAIEKDFSEAAQAIARADLLLFSYPVYTFLAPSQLHRFIELLARSGVDLSGKLVTQITTSKHFYDVTAHRYIEENCFDMGLSVIRGFSADMEDLLSERGRHDAKAFWRYVHFCGEHQAFLPSPAARAALAPYVGGVTGRGKDCAYDVLVVADGLSGDAELARMVADFEAVAPFPVRIVDIADYPFQGGCLGCFRCAVTGRCVYTDGFDTFLRERIQSADAIVYAYTIRNHSMGARFKMYDDRQFCNGHRTVTEGMPVGYLVRGDYAGEGNLRMAIEGRADVGGNFLAGVATDGTEIVQLAETLRYALDEKLTLPRGFLGVGGMKIFRDLIYEMRGMMRADHAFYKKHGLYADYPQRHPGKILKMQLIGALLSIPNAQKKLGNRMNEGMLAPYKKAIERE